MLQPWQGRILPLNYIRKFKNYNKLYKTKSSALLTQLKSILNLLHSILISGAFGVKFLLLAFCLLR